MKYAKIVGLLALGFAALSAPVQARPQVDGAGLVSPDRTTAIVNFGPSLESGKYTYYRLQSGEQRMGTVQLYDLAQKSASGTFEEYSLSGNQGCKGSLFLEVTTPGTARAQEIRWNARWEIEGAIAGKQCDRIGQSTAQNHLSWGRLPQSTVEAASKLGAGTLTADHRQARINLRSQAQLSAKIEHRGRVGDRVRILSSRFGADKYLWYRVELVGSGAQGWVRGDWVSPDFASL